MPRIGSFAALAGALLAGSAVAEGADWGHCAAGDDPDRAIAACSRFLAAGARAAPERAGAHIHRGTSLLRKGEAERAIADFSAALRIDPANAVALNRRGEAYSHLADFRRALADYTEAVQLNPQYPLAFRNRARLHFYRGDFAAAAEDFRLAEHIDPRNGYSLLWRFVAEARTGVVDIAGLHRGAALLREAWPKPLVRLFLGRATAAEALAAAGPGPVQRCEAHFFIGQRHILADAKEAAAVALRHALAVCPPYMVEHHATRIELQRLGDAAR